MRPQPSHERLHLKVGSSIKTKAKRLFLFNLFESICPVNLAVRPNLNRIFYPFLREFGKRDQWKTGAIKFVPQVAYLRKTCPRKIGFLPIAVRSLCLKQIFYAAFRLLLLIVTACE